MNRLSEQESAEAIKEQDELQDELDDFLLGDQEEERKIPSSSDMTSLLPPPSGSFMRLGSNPVINDTASSRRSQGGQSYMQKSDNLSLGRKRNSNFTELTPSEMQS